LAPAFSSLRRSADRPARLYKGYYCFEWEKRWHPGIDEPGVAFPHYAKTMRRYLAEAGVSA
jgi:hypothetical protein